MKSIWERTANKFQRNGVGVPSTTCLFYSNTGVGVFTINICATMANVKIENRGMRCGRCYCALEDRPGGGYKHSSVAFIGKELRI